VLVDPDRRIEAWSYAPQVEMRPSVVTPPSSHAFASGGGTPLVRDEVPCVPTCLNFSFISYLLLSRLELSDTKVYEP